MTTSASGRGADQPAGTVSVCELVRRRIGSAPDPWDLALVQRAEAWDQVRMRHLLDSLLAGYPIGSILLCRVPHRLSKIIRVDSTTGARHVAEAAPESWQLLDGQQRINALVSLFTEEGRYGRFYLHMTVHREPPGPASRRRTKDRALSYIAWQERAFEPDAEAAALELIPERDQHLDLSRCTGGRRKPNGTAPSRCCRTSRRELGGPPTSCGRLTPSSPMLSTVVARRSRPTD